VVFDRAYTPMATTLPAHVSLLTGTNPSRHGVLANLQHFLKRVDQASDLAALPEMLQRAGYKTAAFVSARPLGRHTGISVGFETFDEPEERERIAGVTTDRALAWLGFPGPEALFLWVHYFDPHKPYEAPAPYSGRYQTDAQMESYLRSNHFSDVDGENVEQVNNGYDGEVRYMDEQVGRLLQRLREAGLYETAVIVIVGDHGEGLGQHSWLRHGKIYNEQIRIPLMIRFPARLSIPAGRRESLASIIDILPTLDAVLGLRLDETDRAQLEGINLFDPEAERNTVWSERVVRKGRWESGRKYSLTGKRWKYFHLTDWDDELYDLQADRFELRNVITRHPEVAAELREKLLGQLRAYEERPTGLAVDEKIPPEIREQLRRLGYVD
jgi:arylsulfatase A-like enzyme